MEHWEPIPSLCGTYEASNFGRIRRGTEGRFHPSGFVLKTQLMRGYERIVLYFEGSYLTRSVHRLVAEAFFGPIPEDMQINHRNGIKHDNRIENLEICSAGDNSSHRTHVLKKQNPPPVRSGERNGRAKLSDADIPEIFRLRALGFSQQKIADAVGIHQTNISRILLGKTGFKV